MKQCEYEGCGKLFEPTSHNQRFHTLACGKAHRRHKAGGMVDFHRVCPLCFKEFTTVYKRQVYCGSVCQKKNKLAPKKTITCECGRVIPKNSNNQVRCRECAADLRRKQAMERRAAKRNINLGTSSLIACPWESGEIKQVPYGGIM